MEEKTLAKKLRDYMDEREDWLKQVHEAIAFPENKLRYEGRIREIEEFRKILKSMTEFS